MATYSPSSAGLRRRHAADWAAALLVRLGGAIIVLSILGIFAFIVTQVLPLFRPARVELKLQFDAPIGEPRGLFSDPGGKHVVELDRSGQLTTLRLSDGAVVASVAPLGEGRRPLAIGMARGRDEVALAAEDGRIVVAGITWDSPLGGENGHISPQINTLETLDALQGVRLDALALQSLPGRRLLAAARGEGGVTLLTLVHEENVFTGEITARLDRRELPDAGRLRRLEIDDAGRRLYGVRADEGLVWWRLDGTEPIEAQLAAPPSEDAVTAVSMLIGGRSLLVGRAGGSVEVWFEAEQAGRPQLVLARTFDLFDAPVAALAPSRRYKAAFAASASGDLSFFHSTSERTLWTGHVDGAVPTALLMAPKGDAALVAAPGRIDVFSVDAPHPEVSLGALFGRVWYEGYPAPEFVWQSSSGTDDFEPKLSLVPLLFGTIKGTLYSLLIAVPLAVFGAMYVAQFMAPELRRIVKPVVEVMASMPSVVLGFLAGLWLAPRLAASLPVVLCGLVLLPLGSIASGAAWGLFPARWRRRLPRGTEVVFFVGGVLLSGGLSFLLGPLVQQVAFGGDLLGWFGTTLGLPYDQRNAVVVGIAMGFAVIPIIFAIAEDAFENVPETLVSASLALGANRWQTVTRVVFPTASPGIFSAIMVGFGRAVGETMIVLMATGNTPILDWSPFSGFRSLSANIAVEIPEAPQGASLYRVLFLAALALFVLTFVVNTMAELVRHRLRRRYASL